MARTKNTSRNSRAMASETRRSPSPSPKRHKGPQVSGPEGPRPRTLHRVSVEGNIGAGKSSLVARLDQTPLKTLVLMRTVQEPVEDWEQSGMLARMYSGELDPFQFQVYALATRTKSLVEAVDSLGQEALECEARGEEPKGALLLVERDMQGDCSLFARHYLTGQQLLDYQKIHAVHCELVESALARWGFRSEDHIVAVRVPPEIAAMRVTKRDRAAEKNLSLKTLIELDALHENYYSATTNAVWFLDANQSPDAVHEAAVHILDSVTRVRDSA